MSSQSTSPDSNLDDEPIDIVVGAAALAMEKTPRAKSVGEAKALAAKLIAQARALEEGERICTGKAKVRDAEGKPVVGPDGKIVKRPCKNHAIRGGFVCQMHGGSAPQVRKKAARRLLAMAEPAMIRLGELAHQDGHLPTALGAVKEILERAGNFEQALGPKAARAEEKDTRPIINIGIVGGVPLVTVQGKPVLEGAVTPDE